MREEFGAKGGREGFGVRGGTREGEGKRVPGHLAIRAFVLSCIRGRTVRRLAMGVLPILLVGGFKNV